MHKVEIHHRATGPSSDSKTEAPQVVLDILEETITARELIRRTVSEHLRKLGRESPTPPRESTLSHLYLTESEIRSQADSGKIALENSPSSSNIDPDPATFESNAIKSAEKAFRLGRFTILIAGRQIDDLNTPLSFEDQTKVIFLRLVPLAGG